MDLQEHAYANGKAETESDEESSLHKIVSKLSPEKISEFARDLPAIVEREVKENPYRTLGIAAGVGFGVGAIVGSKLLRTMLLATGGILASEMARGRIKRLIDELVEAADEVNHESNGEKKREGI
ncbi:DUF883 C-terminal domain-containing protein [Pendulispora rubella]|uniref:DUF883 C-terminal domain-containing protein n=1 Tax=Pendulispora rubella TaxID=2741070 RepID=A0ABZ2LAR9_9BACT